MPVPIEQAEVSVDLIDSPTALAALESEWWQLFERAVGVTPFQSPAWLIPWFETWGEGRTRVYVVRRHARWLIALFPAVTSGDRLECGGSGVGDYLGALVEPDEAEVAGSSLDHALHATACLLHDVPPDAVWPAATSGWLVDRASPCPTIELPPNRETYFASLPHGLRRNLKRYGEKLDAAAQVAYQTIHDQAALLPALEELFALHGMRWEVRGSAGILSPIDVKAFHRRAAPRLLRAGLLRLHLLTAGGTVVAAQYVLRHRDRAFSYIGGWNPEWNRFSPGSLLMAHSIGSAIDEGCTVFDLLRGSEPYKYSWGAVDRWTQSFHRPGAAPA